MSPGASAGVAVRGRGPAPIGAAGRPGIHYTKAQLIEAIRAVGIRSGDIVFSHVGMGLLGFPEEGASEAAAFEVIHGALREVLGSGGTLLIPTYSYSFCKGEPYHPMQTRSDVGPFSERFRRLEEVRRSLDPIFSVAAIGPAAEELLRDLPWNCFGPGCVYERLLRMGAIICTVGVGVQHMTFVHYVEQSVGVPYRFLKLFTGIVEGGEGPRKEGWLYNVRVLQKNCDADFRRLAERVKAQGRCRAAPAGRSEVTAIRCADLDEAARGGIAEDPWFLARGPATDLAALEEARVPSNCAPVPLPPGSSMPQMIEALWHLPRDLVSDGYDAALSALAAQVPMAVHAYPSGTPCWTWVVPEKWTCHEAALETLGGTRIFSYADHPLHVVSYSLPFEGEVSRQELFEHLHVHPGLPDAVPFTFKYYERDWGLCCTQRQKAALTDPRYRVVIRAGFSYGRLKVGEVVARGRTDKSIMLCAHLCHPGMVNDDLTGVVVGIEVMRALLARKELRYTYRFLIVPETIGSLAYLSHHESLIPRMAGGLFLEMLGLQHPHALQFSMAGDTEIDRCFALAQREHDPGGRTLPFQVMIGNDERQFNAPGVRVPMLSLSRMLPSAAPGYPYREYHSSHDNPSLCSVRSLEESRDLVLRMIDALEANVVPVNRFKGEVFLSRYGLYLDWYSDPDGRKPIFDLMYHVDGTRSVAEIAEACGIPFDAAWRMVKELGRHGLVEYLDDGEGGVVRC